MGVPNLDYLSSMQKWSPLAQNGATDMFNMDALAGLDFGYLDTAKDPANFSFGNNSIIPNTFGQDMVTGGGGGGMPFLSTGSQQGWGGLALGAAQGAFGAYSAYQQSKNAKAALDFTTMAFNTNLKNSQKSYNTDIEDRQRSRVASNASAYESVGAYMSKNKLG